MKWAYQGLHRQPLMSLLMFFSRLSNSLHLQPQFCRLVATFFVLTKGWFENRVDPCASVAVTFSAVPLFRYHFLITLHPRA